MFREDLRRLVVLLSDMSQADFVTVEDYDHIIAVRDLAKEAQAWVPEDDEP